MSVNQLNHIQSFNVHWDFSQIENSERGKFWVNLIADRLKISQSPSKYLSEHSSSKIPMLFEKHRNSFIKSQHFLLFVWKNHQWWLFSRRFLFWNVFLFSWKETLMTIGCCAECWNSRRLCWRWDETDNRVFSYSIEARLLTSSCGSANSVFFFHFYPHLTQPASSVDSMDFSAVDKLSIFSFS